MQSNFAMVRRTSLLIADEKIIETLTFAEDTGMSKKDLIQNTGFDQSTIYRRSKVLEEKGVVKLIKKGQRTSYILTNNVLKDNYISAIIIGRFTFNELIKKKIGINNYGFRFPFKNSNRCYTTNMKPGKDDLELALFDLSMNIGSLIVLSLLHYLGPDNEKFKKMNRIDIHKAIQTALEIIFRRLIFSLLANKFFLNKINQCIHQLPLIDLKNEDHIRNDFFDKKKYDKIMSSFEKVFPDTFHVMSKLIQELPKRIESEKEIIKYANEDYIRSTKCQHKYGTKERNEGKTLQTCKICGHIKLIRTRKNDLIQKEFNL